MMRIFKYFYIILLVSACLDTFAQEGRIKGIRFGYDVSRPVLQYLEPKRYAYEVSADFEPKLNYYTTVEYGQQRFDLAESGYNYSSAGYYARIGFDYNFSKQRMLIDHYEMIYGGFRYAFASYSHVVSDLVLPENYWGGYSIPGFPEKDLSAHWFEIVAGIRGELFKNFFIGWSFRGRVLLWQKKDPVMDTNRIPGYGVGNKKSQLGFNYSIYYRIPLYKTKNKPKTET